LLVRNLPIIEVTRKSSIAIVILHPRPKSAETVAPVNNENMGWRFPQDQRWNHLVVKEAGNERCQLFRIPVIGLSLKVRLSQQLLNWRIFGEIRDWKIRKQISDVFSLLQSEILPRDHRININPPCHRQTRRNWKRLRELYAPVCTRVESTTKGIHGV